MYSKQLMNKKDMTLGNRSRGNTLSQLKVQGDVISIMTDEFEHRNMAGIWKAG